MKACVYIRVSTDEQRTDMQHDAIKKYCAYHNLDYDVFEEKESGAKRDRPVLNLMMEQIRAGKYDRLVVYKLDRIARSTLHFAAITEEVKLYGCDFVSVTEGIDFSTDVGQMVANILAVIADFERKVLITRVKGGLAAAKKRGKKLGHAPRPFDITRYNELKNSGLTMAQIAEQMGFSRSQLFERLKSVG